MYVNLSISTSLILPFKCLLLLTTFSLELLLGCRMRSCLQSVNDSLFVHSESFSPLLPQIRSVISSALLILADKGSCGKSSKTWKYIFHLLLFKFSKAWKNCSGYKGRRAGRKGRKHELKENSENLHNVLYFSYCFSHY